MALKIGIIPCAGTSSRLFNLPKFLLPMCNENKSLISHWISLLNEKCDKIIIGVSQTNLIFINHLLNTQYQNELDILNKIVIKIVGNTKTMNETIIKCLENEIYQIAIMCMPDTYVDNISDVFINELLNNPDAIIGSFLWNIRNTQIGKIGQCECNIDKNIITNIVDKDKNCQYKYGWGCVVFKPEFEKYIMSEELHIGYSMKNALNNNITILCKISIGMYFDCGTIEGYKEYINYLTVQTPVHIKGTIIVVAIYINNEDKNYDILINCLKQLRTIYKYNTIITVDNKSLNANWYNVAKELNMIILKNNSILHRYEMGAYKLALQYFRADKYIFIQGTFFIYNKLNLKILDENKPNIIAFNIVRDLCWSEKGLELINTLLNSINLKSWDFSEQILIQYCSFCANNLFIKEMLNDAVFDLISNTKNHSCALERILGRYSSIKLNTLNIHSFIENQDFKKTWLNQEIVTI